MTTEPGFYLDPYDAEVYRQWDGERWTPLVRTGPNADPVPRFATHVGTAEPVPGAKPAARAQSVPQAPAGAPAAQDRSNGAALAVAVIWALIAAIVGLVFILGTEDVAYGGDAYTGIQNTGAQTVRAVGWLILATGPLGLIIALSRR